MDAIKTQVDFASCCGRLLVALCALALACLAVPATGFSQGDPTSSGGTQKPYIMILMDTSASMEWTDEGDEEYPKSEDTVEPWEAGSPMSGVERYGSCYLWEIDECDDYERPAWLPDENWTDAYGGDMETRLGDMQDGDVRLRNASQPRHVTLKEILTGEMVLGGTNYTGSTDDLDPRTHGPGCWLVPRQRFATSQRQQEVCLGYDEFEDLPDHREPRPHFQEVHDGQRANGLMDTVAGNAIFALAMFDGFKESHEEPTKDWKTKGHEEANHLDDPMDEPFANIEEGRGDPSKVAGESDYNYNLGVYQIISTKDMDVSTTLAGQISTFVQIALVDAGYLTHEEKHKLKPDKDDGGFDPLAELTGLDLNFSKDLKKYMHEHTLGRQPVAKATPYAAAMYDIHHFFAHGPKGKDNKSPVIEDPFKACRPKHVIMLGDGHPEPEDNTSGGVQVGGNTLNAAFGYDPDRYPYSNTEDAIKRFMHDINYDGADSARVTPGDENSYLAAPWGVAGEEGLRAAKYNPRVHVVGHNGRPGDGHEEVLEGQIAHKLAAMASMGQSCASRSLGDSWIPESEGGDCKLDERHCLDPRQVGYPASSFDYIDQTNDASECKLPALLLTTELADTQNASDDMADPVAAMAAALQLTVNDILASGVASRTRPTFVNRIDDPTTEVGGQYRFFSGMSIDTGRIFWRGLMYRRTNKCTDLNPSPVPPALPIHDDIEKLAGDDGDTSDSRRIFTVLADENSFDYEDRHALKMGGSRYRFMFGMDLAATQSDEGQFGTGYLSSKPNKLKDTRIPFEFDQLEAAVGNMTNGLDLYEYFQTQDEDDLKNIIDEVRGRTALKDGAAFGAILNSSPVAVEPPALDLPIDSYREYKALYGDRPSMVYVSTTDGLLHGIYTGALDDTTDDDQVLPAGGGSPVTMHDQREAWAYLPQMLHNDLKVFAGQQPNLLDGTPTVKDVRLCHKSKDYNQNEQACRYECTSTECEQRGSNQWRTVLVAGRGQAGAGYFALDVSRPGGIHPDAAGTTNGVEAPDPIPLWEFDPNWERGQVYETARTNYGEGLVYPANSDLLDGDFIDECDDDKSDDEYFWDQPFLGTSVGEAAIGTVAVKPDMDTSTGGQPLRRAVAVFSGGNTGDYGTCDGDERVGRAIYVVDLQTGTILRRFVSYFDEDGEEKRFPSPVNGSPALYDSSPGSLATRGFVGDGQGRLYRIDMSSEEPINWKVRMFFDPTEDDEIDDDLDTDNLAPASHRPALALGTVAVEKDLLVFYGLGERGDLNAGGKAGALIAVREKTEVDGNGDTVVKGERIWHVPFEDPADGDYAEQLTGEPIVFNSGVYFTTFVKPADDRCMPGWSRIYGMKFEGKKSDFYTLENEAEGVFVDGGGAGDASIPDGTAAISPDNDDSIWGFEPENTNDLAEDIIIRGLAITLGPSCSTNPAETDGGISASSSQQPTLIAQSSSSQISGDPGSVGSGADELFTLEHSLPRPKSQNIPLSWSIIDN